MIRFACGTCGNVLRAPDALAGKKGRCALCGTVNRVPAAAPGSGAPTAGAEGGGTLESGTGWDLGGGIAGPSWHAPPPETAGGPDIPSETTQVMEGDSASMGEAPATVSPGADAPAPGAVGANAESMRHAVPEDAPDAPTGAPRGDPLAASRAVAVMVRRALPASPFRNTADVDVAAVSERFVDPTGAGPRDQDSAATGGGLLPGLDAAMAVQTGAAPWPGSAHVEAPPGGAATSGGAGFAENAGPHHAGPHHGAESLHGEGWESAAWEPPTTAPPVARAGEARSAEGAGWAPADRAAGSGPGAVTGSVSAAAGAGPHAAPGTWPSRPGRPGGGGATRGGTAGARTAAGAAAALGAAGAAAGAGQPQAVGAGAGAWAPPTTAGPGRGPASARAHAPAWAAAVTGHAVRHRGTAGRGGRRPPPRDAGETEVAKWVASALVAGLAIGFCVGMIVSKWVF